MQQLRYAALVLLVSGALIAGCSSQAPAPTAQPSAQPPASTLPPTHPKVEAPATAGATQSGGGVTEAQIATAETVLVSYLDAVVNQDQAVITFLWAGNAPPKTPPVPKGPNSALILEIKVLKTEIKDEKPTVHFEVKADLGTNPGGAWSPGVNHRWATLEKQSEGWKVKVMATSPFNFN